MAAGEGITIHPSDEFAEGNPHTATVFIDPATGENGYVWIEPPCFLSKDYLEDLEGDVGVQLHSSISDVAATLVKFGMTDGTIEGKSVEASVEHTVTELLNDLGKASNPDLIVQEFKRVTNE
jgi:hypothetical protein